MTIFCTIDSSPFRTCRLVIVTISHKMSNKQAQLKDCFIAYAVNSSAIKVGAGNVNNSDF